MRDLPEAEALLRHLVVERVRVGRFFAACDTAAPGAIAPLEFRAGLEALGFTARREDCDGIFSLVDADGAGLIGAEELKRVLDWAHGQWSADRGRKLLCSKDYSQSGEVHGRLKRALEGSTARLAELFREWGMGDESVLSRREFCRALALLGMRVDMAHMHALFDEFDADCSGLISLSELQRRLELPSLKAKPKARLGAGEAVEAPRAVDDVRADVLRAISEATACAAPDA